MDKKVDSNNDSFVEMNQKEAELNALKGEDKIIKYDDINPDHSAHDDIPEIQSTDDV